VPSCSDGKIIRVSRQNSSGTYVYFREAVLGERRDYKQGTTAQSGSSDVVALVSKTPCAIGYSGMGYYKADLVKMVKVAKEKGEPAVAPSIESALDGTYPISRPLYLYTLGEPSGTVQEFIQWVRSAEGQKTVEEQGYVPLPKEPAAQ
jgi:phosphate transport system substrate-binding protein